MGLQKIATFIADIDLNGLQIGITDEIAKVHSTDHEPKPGA